MVPLVRRRSIRLPSSRRGCAVRVRRRQLRHLQRGAHRLALGICAASLQHSDVESSSDARCTENSGALAIAALSDGARLLARGLSFASAAPDACAELGLALPVAGADAVTSWATKKAATRQLGERQVAGKLRLTLLRACVLALAWRDQWILGESATGEARFAFAISLLGGCSRLPPVINTDRHRPVWRAPSIRPPHEAGR